MSTKLIGQIFSQRRQELGLSLREVSLKTALPVTWINRLERGVMESINCYALFRLCQFYGISPNFIASLMGFWKLEEEEEEPTLVRFTQFYRNLPAYRKSEINRILEALVQGG